MADHFLSVSEASRGPSRMVQAALNGETTVITRYGKAVAACLPMGVYAELLEAEERHALTLQLMREAPFSVHLAASATSCAEWLDCGQPGREPQEICPCGHYAAVHGADSCRLCAKAAGEPIHPDNEMGTEGHR